MALQVEIWVKSIIEGLFANNTFAARSIDHSEFVNEKTVHVPNAGAAPNVEKNRTVFPANVTERKDVDLTYQMDEFTVDPVRIPHAEQVELSYNKRESVTRQSRRKLAQDIYESIIYNWIPEGVKVVETLGEAVAAHIKEATGNRKRMTKQTVEELQTLFDEQDIPEEEYFLIDKEDYKKRPDLILTGRTLFGAMSPKGQEMEDHYFGSIRPRVKAFMADLDEELWKLGINAKTEHNEVAPCQHEMAPIFATANIATDHNQLTMEIMKKVADRHGLVCLLHEKPFDGVNGSGKHNNWSISTDKGENLLDPGSTPMENAQFLLFLTAVIKAVDEYQDLLRLSVASAGNDHRLGANEAPPAIVSMYVGDELAAVIHSLVDGTDYKAAGHKSMDIGVTSLPHIPQDNSDRNRTSPFAFTGNKFEFRMPGSSFNIACTNIMLNTAVADELMAFADELEKADDFETALSKLIRRELAAHKRILFNGNGYSAEWPIEAEKRGLLNLRSTPEALLRYTEAKNVAMFARHGIYTETEIKSRQDINMEEYAKVIHIEALTSLDMLGKMIVPACTAYSKMLAEGVAAKKSIGVDAPAEVAAVRELTDKTAELMALEEKLKDAVAGEPEELNERAMYEHETVIPAMEAARKVADELELKVGKAYWPMPTYADLLFYV